MWFWGKKKETSGFKKGVVQSFESIGEDINAQKQWISYLNNIHKVLMHAHDEHKALTKNDIETIKTWIVHLDNMAKRHAQQVFTLENNIRSTFAAYNKYFVELNKRLSEANLKEEQIKELISHEISEYAKITKEAIVESKGQSEVKYDDLHNRIMNVKDRVESIETQSNNMKSELHDKINQRLDEKGKEIDDILDKHKEVTGIEIHKKIDSKLDEKYKQISDMQKNIESQYLLTKEDINKIKEDISKQSVQIQGGGLTNPEQKFLNLLLAQPDPVSYALLAEKTGNSINTVRVIMNSLKKHGVIEENTLPSGVKLFNAVNKEKIKKLYNVEHI